MVEGEKEIKQKKEGKKKKRRKGKENKRERKVGMENKRMKMKTSFKYLLWEIPWMEEPGRLWSMGLLRVGHGWATSLLLFTFMHWKRKWQPTPVFLPGASQGGEAWWAAIYGVAQSRTWLKRLSSTMGSYIIRTVCITHIAKVLLLYLHNNVPFDNIFLMSASQVVLEVKNPPVNAGHIRSSIPGSGWSTEVRNGTVSPVLLPGKFHGQKSLEGYSL